MDGGNQDGVTRRVPESIQVSQRRRRTEERSYSALLKQIGDVLIIGDDYRLYFPDLKPCIMPGEHAHSESEEKDCQACDQSHASAQWLSTGFVGFGPDVIHTSLQRGVPDWKESRKAVVVRFENE